MCKRQLEWMKRDDRDGDGDDDGYKNIFELFSSSFHSHINN